MSGPFFGELYLRSTKPFLPDYVTEAEVDFLHEKLSEPKRSGPVLDVGCGHGRHLGPLQRLPRLVTGVELDPQSLEESRAQGPVARADFFQLPFRGGAFSAAYAWYNSLFTFEDDQIRALVKEIARVLEPQGLFLVHATNVEGPRSRPEARYDSPLPDGGHLLETVHFDEKKSRDEVTRTLTLPDGRVMAASFFIRYYALDEWKALLAEAGLEVTWVCGDVEGRPLSRDSMDQIVGASKRVDS